MQADNLLCHLKALKLLITDYHINFILSMSLPLIMNNASTEYYCYQENFKNNKINI